MGIRYAQTENGVDRVMRDGRTLITGKVLGTIHRILSTRAAAIKGIVPNTIKHNGPWERVYREGPEGSKLWMLVYVKGFEKARTLARQWMGEVLDQVPEIISYVIDPTRSPTTKDEIRINVDAVLANGQRETLELDVRYAS